MASTPFLVEQNRDSTWPLSTPCFRPMHDACRLHMGGACARIPSFRRRPFFSSGCNNSSIRTFYGFTFAPFPMLPVSPAWTLTPSLFIPRICCGCSLWPWQALIGRCHEDAANAPSVFTAFLSVLPAIRSFCCLVFVLPASSFLLLPWTAWPSPLTGCWPRPGTVPPCLVHSLGWPAAVLASRIGSRSRLIVAFSPHSCLLCPIVPQEPELRKFHPPTKRNFRLPLKEKKVLVF